MKYLLLIVTLVFAFGCSNYGNTEYHIGDDETYLVVTRLSTKTELDSIAKKLSLEKGISLDLSKSEFNRKGLIKNLVLKVDCNDGFSGTASADGAALELGSYGFYVDHRPDSKMPFQTGSMEWLKE